jgi:aspartyl aminopeptidase
LANGSDFTKAFLESITDWHEGGVSGRTSGWERATAQEIQAAKAFAGGYVASLKNKSVWRRLKFLEGQLRRNGYKSMHEVTGAGYEAAFRDSAKTIKRGTRFYSYIDDTMLAAIEIGSLKEGILLGGAHIDSVCLVGSPNPVAQNYNLAFMPCGVRGGLEPKDFMGVPLMLNFHGPVSGSGTLRLDEIVIGEKDDEPKFALDEESAHLAAGKLPNISDLQVIMGNFPYHDAQISRRDRLVASVYYQLQKQHNLTKDNLGAGDITFVPAQKPFFGDLESSTVVGYGQDNWSSAYLLLRGLVKSEPSRYTKIAIFYDKEEIGDRGPGALSHQYIENLVLPMIAGVTKANIPSQWKQLRNCWSLFCDVTGAVSNYIPEKHDPRDTSFMGSGVVISKSSGDETEWHGYISKPATIHALRELFKEAKVMNQVAIMGTRDYKAPGASDNFHPALARGIDIGLPLLSMHRPTERTSTIDIWNMYRGITAFFSVNDIERYFPQRV